MPLKKQKKAEQKKDSKSELELIVQSAINSSYNLIIPVVDESIIHIKDPVDKKLVKLKLDSPEYFALLDTLVSYGLTPKLDKDFEWVQQYNPNYTNSWNKYKLSKQQ